MRHAGGAVKNRVLTCERAMSEGEGAAVGPEKVRMTSTTHAATPVPRWALGIATALAILVAVVYLAIGLGIVPEDFKSPPAPVMLLAGLGYLVGGGLILLADRRLLLAGAVVNALILLLFVMSALLGDATVDLLSSASAGRSLRWCWVCCSSGS